MTESEPILHTNVVPMIDITSHNDALDRAAQRLRSILATMNVSANEVDLEAPSTMRARDEVIARYQPMFHPDNLGRLTEEDFQGFLLFRNNKHWMALHRLGSQITADLPRLRQALKLLLDESRPLDERLTRLVPRKGPAFVPMLNRAVLTPILLISFPDRYGVWNQVSEAGLIELQLWPDLDRATPFGKKYLAVNGTLVDLARATGVDLWTLDSLLWRVQQPVPELQGPVSPGPEVVPPEATSDGARFGLERHLHEFLRDNWGHPSLFPDWTLYVEDGEEVGYEYRCEVGRIDLLGQHRTKREWLVVELKKNQTSDETVGQVLRYMGWVRKKLAKPGDSVRGLIIAHKADASIRYAISSVDSVDLNLYEVEFKLRPAGPS